MLLLAAKRWFEVVDDGNANSFDRLPLDRQVAYCKRVAEMVGPLPTLSEDPKHIYIFGRPLA